CHIYTPPTSSPSLSSLFFHCSADHRYLHSFPTRRSSDLVDLVRRDAVPLQRLQHLRAELLVELWSHAQGRLTGEHPLELDRIDTEELQVALGDRVTGVVPRPPARGFLLTVANPEDPPVGGVGRVQRVRDGEGPPPVVGLPGSRLRLLHRVVRTVLRGLVQGRGAKGDAARRGLLHGGLLASPGEGAVQDDRAVARKHDHLLLAEEADARGGDRQ